jgi:hypothetical protein
MITTRIQSTARLFIATMSLAAVAVAFVAAPAAGAAGLKNCVDVSGPHIGRVACYEDVWADGAEYGMTFSNQTFKGATPSELDRFYVVAPQSATPQGAMASFPHDHVVRDVPAGGGRYTTKLAGFFVLCTGQGIVTGACVPLWTSPGGPALPFAQTVVGGPLTSTDAIEAAADAGTVALVDLGPGAVIVGTISGR